MANRSMPKRLCFVRRSAGPCGRFNRNRARAGHRSHWPQRGRQATLVNILTGFQAPTSGRVCLGDRDIGGVKPPSRSPDGRGAHLSIRTAIWRTDCPRQSGGRRRRASPEPTRGRGEGRGIAKLDRHCTSKRANGCGTAVYRRKARRHRPRFDAVASCLLLDEPAAGMSVEESIELADLIRKIVAERGCGVF